MASEIGQLGHWLETPLGQTLIERENQLVAEALEHVFGYQILQIGGWGPGSSFLDHSKTLRSAHVTSVPAPGADLVSKPSKLAIASDSIDAVILPHTLELDPHPHQTLREVQRVLVGEGHVLLLGFNPWSLWGARSALGVGATPTPRRNMITEGRLSDWLNLLGLETVQCRRYFFSLPVNKRAVQRRLAGIETFGERFLPLLSGAYLLLAQKRVYRVTPARSSWRPKPRVVGGLVEPTTRIAA